jgi:hypothetical protein
MAVLLEVSSDTVLGHKSEQNPYGTLPRILSNFCPMTVHPVALESVGRVWTAR